MSMIIYDDRLEVYTLDGKTVSSVLTEDKKEVIGAISEKFRKKLERIVRKSYSFGNSAGEIK